MDSNYVVRALSAQTDLLANLAGIVRDEAVKTDDHRLLLAANHLNTAARNVHKAVGALGDHGENDA